MNFFNNHLLQNRLPKIKAFIGKNVQPFAFQIMYMKGLGRI